ncbi:RICIN domain-containing protein [Streptomyces sp. NPDC059489]|uniref:RICIN domain-containing protein n=1 Tax=Streptomyces sp. NPDC059489 TaxID=3346849 RepID=UPI0036AC36C5
MISTAGSGPDNGPADDGPRGGHPSGEGRPPSRNWGAPLLVTAAVVVVLALTVPFVLSTSKHTEDATPAVKVTEAEQEQVQPRTHKIGALPSTSPVSHSPSSSPKEKKPAADAQTPSAPPIEKKNQTNTKTAPKPPSAAALARARADTASHTTGTLLKNQTSGLCADLPGFSQGKADGGVNTHACNGTTGDNQQWDLQVTSGVQGPEGADLFVIKNHKDGLCMTPVFQGGDSTAWIREEACDTSTGGNALWWLMPRSDGTYAVRNYALGSCLNEATPAPGGYHDDRLNQAPCTESGLTKIGWHFG